MKYVIMCGGINPQAKTSRHRFQIHGEEIVDRTIRLLKQAGVKDIAISTNSHLFDDKKVEIIYLDQPMYWIDGFYKTDTPICYLFGDVIFSKKAIRTIVETETDSVQFFASAPPFPCDYAKAYAEPFGFKVVDNEKFNHAIDRVKELVGKGAFKRVPIAWELWQVVKQTPLNRIIYTNYRAINDYTCDVDCENDLYMIKYKVPRYE